MTHLRFSVFSKGLGFPVDMEALMPENSVDIPTLWLFHGANRDGSEWIGQSSLPRYLSGRKLAVITISVFNGFYVDMHRGAAYGTYLEQEWIPTVRNLLPCLSVKRKKNYIAGASMGGFGAFRIAMNRPEVFSKAGAFAGSIEMPTIIERNQRGLQPGGPDFGWAFGGYENMINNRNDVIHMAKQCADRKMIPELYMVCGKDDFGYALNTIARDDLRKAGADVVWRQCEGIHSFDCWDPELPLFLDWLEGKETNA